MAIISKLWNFGKATGIYFYGVVDNTLNPGRPIPRTDLHPRMPAYPYSAAEWIRMFPYRHYWKYFPVIRFVPIAGLIFFCTIYQIIYSPVGRIQKEGLEEAIHHGEGSLVYGKRQRAEDAKYFREYDPKAIFRPEWFKEEISASKLNYFPHGYSSSH